MYKISLRIIYYPCLFVCYNAMHLLVQEYFKIKVFYIVKNSIKRFERSEELFTY